MASGVRIIPGRYRPPAAESIALRVVDADADRDYIAGAMRLLLLLSALLTALAGVASPRVSAQPVAASASASVAASAGAVVAAAKQRFVAPAYGPTPPARLARHEPAVSVAPRALYAERRRE